MKKKYILTFLALMVFIVFVEVVILYRFAMSTGLPGRKGGPQDAFRHTYSTALTARYISPKLVEFVTWVCERDPSSAFDRMDIHNNRIGTHIGLGNEPLYEAVMKKIKEGEVNSQKSDTVTWLPEKDWDMSGF